MNRIARTLRAAIEHPIIGVYFVIAGVSAILLAALLTATPLRAQSTLRFHVQDSTGAPILPDGDGWYPLAVDYRGQYQTDTWTWGGGIVHVVRTDRHDNESVVDWNRRHHDAVMAALQVFPPDHPQNQLLGGRWGIHRLGFTEWEWIPEGIAEPLDHAITTERHDGELLRPWLSRHFDAVNGSRGDFPPV